MRRDAREVAFKIIFEGFFNKNAYDEELLSELKEKDRVFCEEILSNYAEHREELSEKVKSFLIGYQLDRVYRVDLALLYEAIVEIAYINTPAAVAINEAVELAKQYSTDESPKFLNGVLASYVKGETK